MAIEAVAKNKLEEVTHAAVFESQALESAVGNILGQNVTKYHFAGEYPVVDTRVYQNSESALPLQAASSHNWVEVSRIGNY